MTVNTRLCLVGFGNVGQAFARLLIKKKAELAERYGLSVTVTGIITGTHGGAIDPKGVDLPAALNAAEAGQSLNPLSAKQAPNETKAFITACPADFMVETTPVAPKTGQPAIAHIQTALNKDMHVITANKGPVVHAYEALRTLAGREGLGFMFESAVMDGAPIFALFRQPLVGANLISFKGILNSCTNLLLEKMEAVREILTSGGRTLAQGALAWLWARSEQTIPIPGFKTVQQVEENCGAMQHGPLTPDQVREIDVILERG